MKQYIQTVLLALSYDISSNVIYLKFIFTTPNVLSYHLYIG